MFKTEIEGKFDGENLIADDGSCYRVPANYASKSRLVEGDALVLKIDENGSFVFKQINPMPRKMLIADVYEDERKTYVVANETEYKVLEASVSFFKLKQGDQVTIALPIHGIAKWAAIENVINK